MVPNRIQYEVDIRCYSHPVEGDVWATFVDEKIVSVIGRSGPVFHSQYDDMKHLNIGNHVTHVLDNNWIERIL
jgi:hypothetical protein